VADRTDSAAGLAAALKSTGRLAAPAGVGTLGDGLPAALAGGVGLLAFPAAPAATAEEEEEEATARSGSGSSAPDSSVLPPPEDPRSSSSSAEDAEPPM